MGFNLLTVMSAQSYDPYTRLAKMLLRYESVLALGETLNGDNFWLKRLGMSHLDDTGLYTANTEKLSILIAAEESSVKTPNKAASFHSSTFYTGAKWFLGQLSVLFVDHCTDSAS